MQLKFHISPGNNLDPIQSILALQIGAHYVGLAIFDSKSKKLQELKWIEAETNDKFSLDAILNDTPLLKQRFEKIITAFDLTSYTLLPATLNKGDNNSLLHLNGANSQDHVMHEVIGDQITLIYSLSQILLNWCISNLYGSSYWHLQSIRIQQAINSGGGPVLYVNIIEKSFSVIACNKSKLLLARHYKFQAPADMLFYLLKICKIYDLEQEILQLYVSGFIDEDSALYKNLYNYFKYINFDGFSCNSNNTKEYPNHYFQTLNQIAQCGLLEEA